MSAFVVLIYIFSNILRFFVPYLYFCLTYLTLHKEIKRKCEFKALNIFVLREQNPRGQAVAWPGPGKVQLLSLKKLPKQGFLDIVSQDITNLESINTFL